MSITLACHLLAPFVLFVCLTLGGSLAANCQTIAYESFYLQTGSGLAGSGTGAIGWADAGWSGGNDTRFRIVSPIPEMDYQVLRGGVIPGGNRALQLTTDPEPIQNGRVVASRRVSPVRSTLFCSFLVRPIAVGTGSDSIELRFRDKTQSSEIAQLLGGIALRPAISNDHFNVTGVQCNTGGGAGGGNTRLFPGQTYLVCTRISVDASVGNDNWLYTVWLNPSASMQESSAAFGSSCRPTAKGTKLDTISVEIASMDTGGPVSKLFIDEFRIGYTWADVVPQGPQPTPVEDLAVDRAIRLKWLAHSGKLYQVQGSFDLTNWTNIGSPIAGEGDIHTVFDAPTGEPQKYYRVVENP